MNVKKQITDENDYEAMDRLAHSITPAKLQPLTAEQKKRWESAKRATLKKGVSVANAVPTLIAVEPRLLQRIDAYVKKNGIRRSQLFSDAVRQRMGIP